GNSLVLVLPKTVCDNYGLEKGTTLQIAMTDNGLFIPAKQNDTAFIKKELESALKSFADRGKKR
ncbi:MAG: hypothetical protein QW303_02660, partial [Nitrososphaerota archaeon]